MPQLALVTTIEPLGGRETPADDTSTFGMTLSAAIEGSGTLTAGMAELLRSWHWQLGVPVVLDAATLRPVTGATVELLDVHAGGSPNPLTTKDDEYDRLRVEMARRWRLVPAKPMVVKTDDYDDGTPAADVLERFRIRGAPTEDLSLGEDDGVNVPRVDTPVVRPWMAELANASSFPYPYAQWLNLAVHFRVRWNGAARPARVVCAPTLGARAGQAQFRYVPGPGPSTRAPVRWPYVPAPGSPLPDAVAYCDPTPVEVPLLAEAIHMDSLWVAPSGSGVFGGEWLMLLRTAAADAFDLPMRLLDALRTGAAPPNGEAEVPYRVAAELSDAVLASLRDAVGTGTRKTASDGPSLLAEWRAELAAAGEDGATLLSAVDRVAAALVSGTDPVLRLAQWKELLRTVLANRRGAGSAELLPREGAEPEATRDLLLRLEQVVNAVRDPETAADLMVEQWKRVPRVAAADADALRPLAARPRTVRRLLDAAAAPYWDAWILALRLNAPPAAQRTKLRERLPTLLHEAVAVRFDPRAPSPVHPLSGLWTLRPDAPLSSEARTWVNAWLTNWAKAEDARLVPEPEPQRDIKNQTPAPPTAAQAAARRNWRNATPVPHPLSFELGVVQPDRETAAERDALRHVSGFGVLLRESGIGPWRALNLGSAASFENVRVNDQLAGRLVLDRWGKRPLLVTSRPAFRDGVSDATVSYDNAPISALGPAGIASDHSLMDDGRDAERDQPAFRAVFALPEAFDRFGFSVEWSRMVGLRFGAVYEGAVYARTNSGALPPQLAASPDAPGRLRSGPLTEAPGDAFMRRVWYPRRVAVGQARVNVRGFSDFTTPAVPDRVSLRCRELFGRSAVEAGSEGAFLLVHPEREPFAFEVRRPATDFQTWWRWQQGEVGLDDARRIVWQEYHRRLRDNHAGQPQQSVALDDPAVVRLGAVLLEYLADQGTWERRGSFAWEPAQGDLEGVHVDGLPNTTRSSGTRRAVRVQPVPDDVGASGELFLQNGVLEARVPEGRIFRLVVAGLCDRASARRFDPDYQIGWNADVKLEEHFAQVEDLDKGPGLSDLQVLSPWTLWIEVATRNWAARGRGTAEQGKARVLGGIFTELKPTFTLAAARPDGTFEDGGILTVEARVRHSEYQFVHEARLERQRWVWSGRPVFVTGRAGVPVLPADWKSRWLDRGDPSRPNRVMEWEIRQFGERSDNEVVHHVLDSSMDQLEPTDPWAARSTTRTWKHTLDFSADRGASYHRIAIRVFHRYGALFGEERGEVAFDPETRERWRSVLVPYRPARAPERPSVRLILPLTESVPAGRAGPAAGTPRTPGLIVQFRGAAFEQGGLAERILVETAELAPDPIQTGDRTPPALKEVRALEVQGPIGHSFDPDGGLRRIVTASYIINPPPAHAVDGYFFKLRFGRTVDPGLLAERQGEAPWTRGEVERWSEGHWAQMLPDVRLAPTGGEIEDFELKLEPGRLLTLKGGQPADPVSLVEPHLFEPCLAVTERIMDAAGREAEVYLGVYRRTGPGVWEPLVESAVARAGTRVRARLLLVQMGERRPGEGQPGHAPAFADVTESQFWERIFGGAGGADAAPRDRYRIAAVYPPIDLLPIPAVGGR